MAFVCLGNICRSPTAEGVMRGRVAEAGLSDRIHVESFGTGAWHVGHPPDPRAREEAARHGVALESRARQFAPEDFARLDLVLAMDAENAADLRALAPDRAARAKVRMLRELDPAAGPDLDVPDPYYDAAGGFGEVYALIDAACRGLVAALARE